MYLSAARVFWSGDHGHSHVAVRSHAGPGFRVKKGAKYQASVSLSIDVPGQLMKLGVATDYGICKGTRKDGHKCTMAINQKLGSGF